MTAARKMKFRPKHITHSPDTSFKFTNKPILLYTFYLLRQQKKRRKEMKAQHTTHIFN